MCFALTEMFSLCPFLQMADVSFWNETITINTRSNTLEIITTRELLKQK